MEKRKCILRKCKWYDRDGCGHEKTCKYDKYGYSEKPAKKEKES